ncbi:MAG: endonuclease/exonuclease/phosphatase family protein [Haliangium ochraceum]
MSAALPGALRFVTINLWGENGPHERRLDLIAAELARLDPDVVALQEVRDAPGKVANQAETLAARLGYRQVFAPSTAWGGGVEGLAIVSRFPIAESAHRRLPHATDTEGRIVLSARVEAPSGAMWVHTAHLSYRQHESSHRQDQVVALDAEVVARARDNDQPQVLMGDFNTVAESDEIRWLCGLTSLGGRSVFYQDAWSSAATRPAGPGITWAAENPYRARMGWLRPDRRIDYVFVTAARRDGRGAVRDARVVLDRPDGGGVYPSDHAGVLADVQVVSDAAITAGTGKAAGTGTGTPERSS